MKPLQPLYIYIHIIIVYLRNTHILYIVSYPYAVRDYIIAISASIHPLILTGFRVNVPTKRTRNNTYNRYIG